MGMYIFSIVLLLIIADLMLFKIWLVVSHFFVKESHLPLYSKEKE